MRLWQADAIREVFERLSDDQGGVGLLGCLMDWKSKDLRM